MESEQLANLIHASRYAAGIIILFEMRNDRALDNDAGHRVGEDAFKAISHLDPYLAFTGRDDQQRRSEEHTSELQSLMRNSYAVFCLKQTNNTSTHTDDLPFKKVTKQKKTIT